MNYLYAILMYTENYQQNQGIKNQKCSQLIVTVLLFS